MLAQQFDEWQVWRHPFDVVRTTSEGAPPLGRGSARDLSEQPGLSNAWLAADQDYAALASSRGSQPLEQCAQLTFTSNEGR
jgi:hypothetical protein